MARQDSQSQLKDQDLYEELRTKGDSKQKSARISNAAANRGRSSVGKCGGNSSPYEEWTVEELRQRAKELDLQRSVRAFLSVLWQRHQQERDDSGDGVDDQLPGIDRPQQEKRRSPKHHDHHTHPPSSNLALQQGAQSACSLAHSVHHNQIGNASRYLPPRIG